MSNFYRNKCNIAELYYLIKQRRKIFKVVSIKVRLIKDKSKKKNINEMFFGISNNINLIF